MEMNEILTLAAFYLQIEDVFEDGETLGKLLRCVNLVRGEIASDYFPLLNVETVYSADGEIPQSALQKKLIDVKRVTRNGRAVKFKVYPAFIKTVRGELEIEYSYLPDDEDAGGDAGFSDKISARAIAYGAASEYCLIAGLFEEAVIWEKRFKDSLLSAQRKKSEVMVKQRKWL